METLSRHAEILNSIDLPETGVIATSGFNVIYSTASSKILLFTEVIFTVHPLLPTIKFNST